MNGGEHRRHACGQHLDLRPIAGVYVEALGMVTVQKFDLPQGTLDLDSRRRLALAVGVILKTSEGA